MIPYVIEQVGTQDCVRLHGDLTAELVPALQAELRSRLEKGAKHVCFDLQAAVMLDSSGIGLLIAAANSLARAGGDLEVVHPSPDIYRMLQSMRLVGRLHVGPPSSLEPSHG